MNYSLRTLFLAAFMASAAIAQPASACIRVISFEQYRSTESFTGRPKSVDFSSHEVSLALRPEVKAVIRETVAKGPNFAGTYTLVTFGCGTGCKVVLIISAKNGRIYKLPEAASNGVKFRANSRLIALIYDPVHKSGGKNYVFDDGEFRELRGTDLHDVQG